MTFGSRFPKRSCDDTPLDFGKHKGRTPNEIARDDPGYIVWLHDTIDRPLVSRQLYLACEHCDDGEGPDYYDLFDN